MRWLLNLFYGLLLTAMLPWIVWRMLRHGRYRQGLAEKLCGGVRIQNDGRPVIWFHAVSVGEVIQLQKVVEEFRRQTADRFAVLISTSTDTGYALAQTRFPGCQLTWFPLDFSWAVSNALRRISPAMVVLMELELWPVFLSECDRRAIPVAVINARMSERSYRRYYGAHWFLTTLFSRLSLVAAQSQANADRLLSLGVRPEVMRVTGSIKFDGVESSRMNVRTQQLRQAFGLSGTDIVFMAGSTQATEEQIALDTWRQLLPRYPNLRLILVPRHRERFEEVARLVTDSGAALIRRSKISQAPSAAGRSNDKPVILVDTIGELSACWGLAEIAFVGGSFGKRGGQNMIEPAAFGACVLFGPDTRNFRDVVQLFKDAAACQQLNSPAELVVVVEKLLSDSEFRTNLGTSAQAVVKQQQGATSATVSMLVSLVTRADPRLPTSGPSTLDCGSLLPLSLASLLAPRSMMKGLVITLNTQVLQQAAGTKAAAGCRSPGAFGPKRRLGCVLATQQR